MIGEQLDGIFATMPSQLRLLVNDTVMQDMISEFRDLGTMGSNGFQAGEMSIWDYLAAKVDALAFNYRMPSKASNVSLGLVHRIGRTDVKLATMPTWGSLTISDIFSDSATATTNVSMHNFCGDVILLQPSAYELVKVKTA